MAWPFTTDPAYQARRWWWRASVLGGPSGSEVAAIRWETAAVTDPSGADQIDAATAVRDLAAALVGHDLDRETLLDVAATARDLAGRIRTGPRRERAGRILQQARETPAGADLVPALGERAVGGPANPTAVPMVIRRDGPAAVVAETVIDPLFEGGEGRAHGGIVAGLLDDITGHLATALRIPAVTGRLSVAYRAVTPVGVPVTFRAWLKEQRGRRLHIEAEARHGATVTATATALYLAVERDRYLRHDPAEPRS